MRTISALQDNTAETTREIAAYVLRTMPRAALWGYNEEQHAHNVETLRAVATGASADRFPSTIELKGGATSVDIYVRLESHRIERERCSVTGDDFCTYPVTIEMNYPSHGSCDAATAVARSAFLHTMALWMADLQATFGGHTVYRRWATKAEREEGERVAAEQKARAIVTKWAEEHSKGMRVDDSNDWPFMVDAPMGSYGDIVLGAGKSERRYAVTARACASTDGSPINMATIVRTS
jgi:hypothetical protein